MTRDLVSHDRDETDVDEPALDERDPHVIFFTSGSTGAPKGVVLSHRVNCLRSFPSLGVAADGGTVCMFPLFHMAGWSLALGAWQARRPIHLVRTPDAETLLSVAAQSARDPDLRDPRGVGPHPRPRHRRLRPLARCAKPTPERPRRHPSSSTRSVARCPT